MIGNSLNWILDKISRPPTLDLKTATEEQLLNYALSLAQEWGPNWMKPINDRLKNIYPDMEPKRVDKYSRVAREAMIEGYDVVSKMLESHGKNLSKEQFQESFIFKYPWVNERNISDLMSTGTYYHHK